MASIKRPWRVGLIINPLAGLGGALARHGSDGLNPAWIKTQPTRAANRAAEAIAVLDPERSIQWLAGPGRMGAALLMALGCDCLAVGEASEPSTAADTRRLARRLANAGVDLLLFAGGDGSARDIMDAVGESVAVLGIPAGVKMQSAVFGVSPQAAGRLALSFLAGGRRMTAPSEVVDLDEAELNTGRVQPRLYGYLATPQDPRWLQAKKARSLPDDRSAAESLAASQRPHFARGLHLIGPGSTTWALKRQLGLDGSLIGIDIVQDGRLLARDADEATLWAAIQRQHPRLWLTVIGGQGYVIGRGNAPLSPRVLAAIGRQAITLLVTPRKLLSLAGMPLRIDSGCMDVDTQLAGPVRVITGPRDSAMARMVAA
ncbi:ATP-NAD kinase family protein [Chromobacterium haemolyticum]|uniref:ATP-NAD kinase family protein n=1 Tax=Chromobacterium haemolyticum TaxID=394935 RepID=UPI0040568C34